MNKQDYINELDSLHASSDLKERIALTAKMPVKKTFNFKKFGAVLAACLSLVIVGTTIFGATLSAEKSADGITETNNFSYNNSNSVYSHSYSGNTDDAGEGTSADIQTESQKIIKTATVDMQTKNAEELIKKINEKIAALSGYTSDYSQNKYNEATSIYATVQIPAERLDEFIEFLGETGTVTSKQITTSNITEFYTDTESKIKAYETEEKTLLGILEKCESVTDIITVQDRLSEIRSELESLNNTKKLYDSQVSYSSVKMSINEVDRVKKASTGFGSEVWEKLKDNLYNIGQFFRDFAVFVLSASPYIAMLAVAVIIVCVIIRKRKHRFDK